MSAAAARTAGIRNAVSGTLLLMPLAVAGNFLGLPLFASVEFIFGSVAAMLAVPLFGAGAALAVAVIGAAYTWHLWGHPYALIIFVAEALTVALLYRRGLRNLVLADLAFWLVIGVPLIIVFYGGALGLGWEAVLLIAFKQPLNGVFNALVASWIVMAVHFAGRARWRAAMQPLRLSDVLFHVLLTVILLAGMVPVILDGFRQQVDHESFLRERLAEKANELARRSRNAVNSGMQWQQILEQAQIERGIGAALLAADGGELARQGSLHALTDHGGQLHDRDGGLAVWLPAGDGASMRRWSQARYVFSLPLEGDGGVSRVVIEAPAASLMSKLNSRYLEQFLLLSGLMVIGIGVARILSQMLAQPIGRLERGVRDLPEQIADGKRPLQPRSAVSEYDILGRAFQDMTDRLTASFAEQRRIREGLAARVREQTEHLRQSQERFVFAVEGAGDGVWDWNMQTNEIGFSRIYEEMLGYAEHELRPHLDTWVGSVHAEDLPGVQKSLSEYLEGRSAAYSVELRLRCKDGNYKWILCRGAVVSRDVNGRPARMIGVHSDIDRRKQMERMKDDFVSIVSHELRTPLTAISGALGLVANGSLPQSSDEGKRMIAMAYRNSQRLSRLLDDLLDMDRIAAGRMRFDMQWQALAPLLERVLEETRPFAAQRQVTLAPVGEAVDAEVRVDADRLTQVLFNLLSNAIKFSDPGGLVELRTQTGAGCVRVVVNDRGPGIPAAFHSSMFQKFSQADVSDTRQKGGSGLGLAISRGLIERMGGRIGFDPREGGGTSFYIELPLRAAADPVRGSGRHSGDARGERA